MKRNLLCTALALTLCSCATTKDSVLLGAGIGAGSGGLSGGIIGGGSNHEVRGALIGTAVGAASGALIGLLIHNGNKKDSKPTPPKISKNDEGVPFLTKPEVRRVWVEDKVDGEKYEEGHYIYLIDKNSNWSLK